jgi:hypothetical protein
MREWHEAPVRRRPRNGGKQRDSAVNVQRKILQFPSPPRVNVLEREIKKSPATMELIFALLEGNDAERLIAAFRKLSDQEKSDIKEFVALVR